MTLPVFHGTADGPFLLSWELNLPLISLILVAGWGYALALHKARARGYQNHRGWYTASFFVGLVTFAIALVGPLDTFNDELFSMHMTQHVVLMQVAAPLLLLGRPVQLGLKALPPRRSGAILRPIIRQFSARPRLYTLMPLAAILAFNLTIVVWHFPVMYVAALESDFIHWFMHFSFFGAGLLFWWGIIAPVPRHPRSQTLWTLVSITVAMIVGKLLGGILTLSDGVIYPFYSNAERPWGLSAIVDQQVAGLIMMVGGGLYFGILFFVILARTLLRTEEDQKRRERAARRKTAMPSPVLPVLGQEGVAGED